MKEISHMPTPSQPAHSSRDPSANNNPSRLPDTYTTIISLTWNSFNTLTNWFTQLNCLHLVNINNRSAPVAQFKRIIKIHDVQYSGSKQCLVNFYLSSLD